MKSILKVVNIISSGQAPPKVGVFLAVARLNALGKVKTDIVNDIRPIAVGNVFHRLTAKCFCVQFCQKFLNDLSHIQPGVGARRVVESIIHSIRRKIDVESSKPK